MERWFKSGDLPRNLLTGSVECAIAEGHRGIGAESVVAEVESVLRVDRRVAVCIVRDLDVAERQRDVEI